MRQFFLKLAAIIIKPIFSHINTHHYYHLSFVFHFFWKIQICNNEKFFSDFLIKEFSGIDDDDDEPKLIFCCVVLFCFVFKSNQSFFLILLKKSVEQNEQLSTQTIIIYTHTQVFLSELNIKKNSWLTVNHHYFFFLWHDMIWHDMVGIDHNFKPFR